MSDTTPAGKVPEPDTAAEPATQAEDEWNAEIDPSDVQVAWNFGTRELTAGEQAEMQDYHRRDFQRWADAEAADQAWRQQRPAERAAQAEPEPEPEAG